MWKQYEREETRRNPLQRNKSHNLVDRASLVVLVNLKEIT